MARKMPPGEKHDAQQSEMTFWEHLEALRWHLVRSIVAVVVLGVVAFLNKELIFNYIILAPKSSDFITNRTLCAMGRWAATHLTFLNPDALCIENFNLTLINIKMAGQFLTHLYISVFAKHRLLQLLFDEIRANVPAYMILPERGKVVEWKTK